MIPEAAVEEVAVRLFDTHEHAWSWEKSAETYRDEARELLEAAAPHIIELAAPRIMAKAWDEGYQAGVREEQPGWTKNPYRPTK